MLRGLDVLLMLFVNEMAGVAATPAFLRHVPPGVDGMTLTDVVFPAFLFVTGMATPLKLGARPARGDAHRMPTSGRTRIARYIVDVRNLRRWPAAVVIAGENALLAYLLAPLLLSLLALSVQLFGGADVSRALGRVTSSGGFVRWRSPRWWFGCAAGWAAAGCASRFDTRRCGKATSPRGGQGRSRRAGEQLPEGRRWGSSRAGGRWPP